MQQDTDQADPLKDAKREFSRAVDEINADILAAGEPRPQWTQHEAIAFECACEAIIYMMAIQSAEIASEASKAAPDTGRLASLTAERSRLHRERLALHVHDHAEIARIRAQYGAAIRARMAKLPPGPAQ